MKPVTASLIAHTVVSLALMGAGVVLGLTGTISGGEALGAVVAGAGLGGAGTATAAIRSSGSGSQA
jgi:hypothetical protein